MNEALGLMRGSTVMNHMGDIGDHMGDLDWHMMDGWNMWLWMSIGWLLLVVMAFLVYRDAESRGMNGLLWFVLVILPWVGFVFLVIYLIAREDRYEHEMSQKSAGAILDERYARGEITREEYRQMKDCLQGSV